MLHLLASVPAALQVTWRCHTKCRCLRRAMGRRPQGGPHSTSLQCTRRRSCMIWTSTVSRTSCWPPMAARSSHSATTCDIVPMCLHAGVLTEASVQPHGCLCNQLSDPHKAACCASLAGGMCQAWYFAAAQGEQMAERLQVPKLRVRRDWYKGLAADHVDHGHPDVGNSSDAMAPRAAQAAQACHLAFVLHLDTRERDKLAGQNMLIVYSRLCGSKQGQQGRRLLMVPGDSDNGTGSGPRRRLLAENEAEHQALLKKLADEHKDRLAQTQQTQQQQTQNQQHTAQQLQQQQQQEQQQLHKGSATGQQQANQQQHQQQQQAGQQQAVKQGGGVFAEDASQVKQDAQPAGTSLGAENAADNELSEEVPIAGLHTHDSYAVRDTLADHHTLHAPQLQACASDTAFEHRLPRPLASFSRTSRAEGGLLPPSCIGHLLI